jgi:hypothetical protein
VTPTSVRWVANLILRGALVGLTYALSACNDEARTREQAKKLFDALSALQDESSMAARQQSLRTLRSLTLTEPVQVTARDACVLAHEELLHAEAEQTAARKALEEAATGPITTQLPPERAATIAKGIESSNAALARAQERFPPCEQAMQKLLTAAR